MVFIGEPNLYVRMTSKFVNRATGKKGFSFDDKGEYETDNPILIKYLSQHFETKFEDVPTKTVKETKPKRSGK